MLLIGVQNGIAAEAFKILGTLTGIYLGMHYYSSLATALGETFFFKGLSDPLLETGSLMLLFVAGYLFFVGLRILLKKMVNTEVVPQLSKWGGLAVAFFRALLLASVALCILVTTQSAYFKHSVQNSLSGTSVVKFAPATYTWVWKSVLSKFITREKLNKNVQNF
jgi:uncharacterized membrane protein required for colicin V production